MARYGYGMSVSGSRTPFVASGGGAEPLGLPAQIIVSGAGVANGTYTKTSSAGVFTDTPAPGTFNYLLGAGIFYITAPGNTNFNSDYLLDEWVLASGNDPATIYSQNTSSDVGNVPASGWSPSITITAA